MKQFVFQRCYILTKFLQENRCDLFCRLFFFVTHFVVLCFSKKRKKLSYEILLDILIRDI